MRLLLVLLISLFTIYCPTVIAQNRILGGFGIGHLFQTQDQNFIPHTRSLQFPYIKYNQKYSSVAVPIVQKELGSSKRVGFGILGYSSIHKNQPSQLLSASQKEVTVYELTTTVFHIEYIFLKPVLWGFEGYLLAGPTLTEAVLTEALELYNLIDDGKGGTEEQFKRVSKKYELDYGIGFTVGTGISYGISENYEISLMARYTYGKTNLSPIEGNEVLSGSTQIQLIFLTRFD